MKRGRHIKAYLWTKRGDLMRPCGMRKRSCTCSSSKMNSFWKIKRGKGKMSRGFWGRCICPTAVSKWQRRLWMILRMVSRRGMHLCIQCQIINSIQLWINLNSNNNCHPSQFCNSSNISNHLCTKQEQLGPWCTTINNNNNLWAISTSQWPWRQWTTNMFKSHSRKPWKTTKYM